MGAEYMGTGQSKKLNEGKICRNRDQSST